MADELRLSIEKLIYGGDGLAHADGNTIFVHYVLPGEDVRANAKSKKKKLIWTELLEVISPAKEREKPKCVHFQKCGGGPYPHIPATGEVWLEKDIFREKRLRLRGVPEGWAGVGENTAHHSALKHGAQGAARL